MPNNKKDNTKLEYWQHRLARAQAAYQYEFDKMDERERLYSGATEIKPITDRDTKQDGRHRTARHVRNIVAENIESEINSSIPQPKVTARRKKDERLAKIIEDMLRDELNRLPMEAINDMQERTVPIQGGAVYHVEWDQTLRSHETTGEITITAVHPKQIIPQDGVYTGIEDMDYVILKVPQTKAYIERRYEVEIDDDAAETEPEIKAPDGVNADRAEDMVTQYIAYYRNDNGGVGLYSWANDTELEDLEDYQARRLPRCTNCHNLKPLAGAKIIRRRQRDNLAPLLMAGQIANGLPLLTEGLDGIEPMQQPLESVEEIEAAEDTCPYCGGTDFETADEEFEELYVPAMRSDGSVIEGMTAKIDVNGWAYEAPNRIPFYKPNVYPLVLQKNISKFGSFLGDSDVDKVADQQNTINRLSLKIIERMVAAGTIITLPPDVRFQKNTDDQTVVYLDDPSKMAYINTFDFTGDLQYEMLYLSQVYEEARQILGITDSWQGRQDSTAQSGKAKQYAAAQSAGRLESKRVMKDAAYAQLFELIFKYRLAYADEPRSIVSQDEQGNTVYEEFNRYDFLEQDEAGNYWWNDQFLFSTDTSAPLANNREQMWENTTAHLQAGAFGDPTQTETLVLYWTKMELLHYPGAADTRTYLEKRLQQERQMQQMQMQMQQQQMQAQQQQQQQQLQWEIQRQAKADAQRDASTGRTRQQTQQQQQQTQQMQQMQ